MRYTQQIFFQLHFESCLLNRTEIFDNLSKRGCFLGYTPYRGSPQTTVCQLERESKKFIHVNGH